MLTADGVGAPSTLLGVQVAEAGQAVGKLIPGCEALPRQLLLAGSAHEAFLVPGLLPVSDTPCGDGLEDTKARVRATPVSSRHLPPLLPVDDVRQPRPPANVQFVEGVKEPQPSGTLCYPPYRCRSWLSPW